MSLTLSSTVPILYHGGERNLSTPLKTTTMYVGCQGMYKTNTNMHQSTKKETFCEDDEWNVLEKLCPSSSKNKQKKILVVAWCLNMMQSAILARLCSPCPLHVELQANQNGRKMMIVSWQVVTSRRKKIEDCWRIWFLKVHWKYILHAFHWATHPDYQHFCVCARACRQISL